MRLNFSGVDEERIREGVRRIGAVVSEQVAMYGTLTGSRPSVSAARRAGSAAAAGAADVVGGAEAGGAGAVGAAGAAGAASAAETPGSAAPDELAKVLRLPAQRKRAG
jgi:2-aminoadipate transaminase